VSGHFGTSATMQCLTPTVQKCFGVTSRHPLGLELIVLDTVLIYFLTRLIGKVMDRFIRDTVAKSISFVLWRFASPREVFRIERRNLFLVPSVGTGTAGFTYFGNDHVRSVTEWQ